MPEHIPKEFSNKVSPYKTSRSFLEYVFIDENSFIKHMYENKTNQRNIDKILRRINDNIYSFSALDKPHLSHDIVYILNIINEKGDFFEEETETVLFHFFIKMAKEVRNNEYRQFDDLLVNINLKEVVDIAINYMYNNYKCDIKIGDIAKNCYISETHLRRIFNKKMNTSVLNYLNCIRIEQACQLLDNTNLSIATIAASCGLPTISTFIRNFNKNIGMTPNLYRKRNKKAK